ncbi:hypothetical protein [Mycoplasma simbae]|uniref:hypothetical protein n=1 Tax=Mycoplasma simbae TaxID=36744 RepID=UPI0004970973|nr:hypothetical protein [Mycoplasma simbae]
MEFIKALFATKQNGTDNLSLTESELGQVADFTASQSLFGLLGTNLPLQDVNRASATFLRNIGHAFKDKEGVGAKEVVAPKLEPITINWQKPKYQAVGFTAADMARGLPNVAPVKLERALKDFLTLHEETAFKALETKALTLTSQKTVKADIDSLTPQNLWKLVADTALKVQNTKSEAEGVKRVAKDDIVIFIKEEHLLKLAQSGIIGNFAQQAYTEGAGAITKLGGYTIVGCPYLASAEILVATNFTAPSMIDVIASNIDKLAPSNDYALYFEAMDLYGIAYTSTIQTVAKS